MYESLLSKFKNKKQKLTTKQKILESWDKVKTFCKGNEKPLWVNETLIEEFIDQHWMINCPDSLDVLQ